jgi:hypothetical protein
VTKRWIQKREDKRPDDYKPEMVKKLLALKNGPRYPVCCDTFPDCDCPDIGPTDSIDEVRK